MARKFLLVPSEAYRELLALSDASPVLAGARGHMDRLLASKKLNASAKNALYNQQLRGFLRLRKDTLERPVKVEIAGGPKLLVGKDGVAAAYTDAEAEEPNEEVQQAIPEVNLRQPTTPAAAATPQQTPRRQRRQRRSRRPPSTPAVTTEESGGDAESSAEEQQQPQVRRETTARTAARGAERNLLEAAFQRHFDKLAAIVQANRDEFDVDAQGQLLNAKRQPMRHSNYRESLHRILRQEVFGSAALAGGSTTPVGTTHLRALLRRNPRTKALLSRQALLDSAEDAVVLQQTTPRHPTVFVPRLWGNTTPPS
jgi:hypothetical protein